MLLGTTTKQLISAHSQNESINSGSARRPLLAVDSFFVITIQTRCWSILTFPEWVITVAPSEVWMTATPHQQSWVYSACFCKHHACVIVWICVTETIEGWLAAFFPHRLVLLLSIFDLWRQREGGIKQLSLQISAFQHDPWCKTQDVLTTRCLQIPHTVDLHKRMQNWCFLWVLLLISVLWG